MKNTGRIFILKYQSNMKDSSIVSNEREKSQRITEEHFWIQRAGIVTSSCILKNTEHEEQGLMSQGGCRITERA